MTIRAVFFDMGGTIETLEVSDELRLKSSGKLNRILQESGIDLGLSDENLLCVVMQGIKKYRDLCLETMIEYSPGKVWGEFIFKDFAVDPEKLERIAEDLAVFIENNFYSRSMRPEVPGVLEAVRKMGLKMGVISNVNSHRQVSENLEKYGIISFFNPIVLSSNYGIRKPDPSIFHYAARLINAPTSSCAYIGDRISRDILGSKKAGYRLSIQIRDKFDHGESDEGAIPDAIIDDMAGFIPILQQEMNRPDSKPTSKIQALLFDAGDVLYYRPKSDSRFEDFLQKLGMEELEQHLQQKQALLGQAFTGQIDMGKVNRTYLDLLGITDPQLVEIGKQILEGDNSNVIFFDGVKETLLSLKNQGYLLGIITDTANSVKTKLEWFERGGFGHVWDSIISSHELGLEKPDPQMYYAALDQLCITEDQAIFVGHRKTELDGAKNIGIVTVGFNRDYNAEADFNIDRFSDLLKIPILTHLGSNYETQH